MTSTQSQRVEGAGQTVDYTEHLTLQITGKSKRHTLRVIVHSDTYADQAWGRIDRHDGTKWHEVASVKGCSLQVDRQAVGYKRDLTPNDRIRMFKADRDALVAFAEEVL